MFLDYSKEERYIIYHRKIETHTRMGEQEEQIGTSQTNVYHFVHLIEHIFPGASIYREAVGDEPAGWKRIRLVKREDCQLCPRMTHQT